MLGDRSKTQHSTLK